MVSLVWKGVTTCLSHKYETIVMKYGCVVNSIARMKIDSKYAWEYIFLWKYFFLSQNCDFFVKMWKGYIDYNGNVILMQSVGFLT